MQNASFWYENVKTILKENASCLKNDLDRRNIGDMSHAEIEFAKKIVFVW